MIELSKRQLYAFLIALMTVTQNVCLKKKKTHKNYLYIQSNYFLFVLLISLNLLKIDLCIFLYQKYVF